VYACGVQIEVYSDLVCPWCYVGKARLASALAVRSDIDIQVRWLPFELNPAMPLEGRDRREYMQERFGDLSRLDAAQKQLTALGAELGLQFNFDAVLRSPNTRRAHLLLQSAAPDNQQQLVERLFRAYFTEGKDIGDESVLLDLAAESGLSAIQARTALSDPQLIRDVEQLQQQARDWRISGVPSFIFARRVAFSGAQPTEMFLRAIDTCLSGNAPGQASGVS
jgi:predicted DsbA family dithiol-disulfide isomerase